MAIMGANTEPIRYRKLVILSMGNIMAAAVPMTVTATAAHFSLIFWEMDTLDTPADYASRKVVVTVESTMMSRPVSPRPAFTIMMEMSYSPV